MLNEKLANIANKGIDHVIFCLGTVRDMKPEETNAIVKWAHCSGWPLVGGPNSHPRWYTRCTRIMFTEVCSQLLSCSLPNRSNWHL